MSLNIVVAGLSITSSWGNGHATTYRGLIKALHRCGHRVTFLERDVPWYAENRDLPQPAYCDLILYRDLADLHARAGAQVRAADAVIVGSYVPEGADVCGWCLRHAGGVTAFYDIDTPITLAALERGECTYLDPTLLPAFDLYLSFTGGPVLHRLEKRWSVRRAAALYCAVDPKVHFPAETPRRWLLGYLGTYSEDRQPSLDALLLEPARRRPDALFAVAGPQYPATIAWPANVERIEHLPPAAHREFYSAQAFTLNITRRDMRSMGWSPSVRLFEAAACATPIITDPWPGLGDFFTPGSEVFVASRPSQIESILDVSPTRRAEVGRAARARVLAHHTADRRAAELEALLRSAGERARRSIAGDAVDAR